MAPPARLVQSTAHRRLLGLQTTTG